MTAALKASCASSCDACRKYLQFTRDSRKLRRRSGYACGGTRACGDGFSRRRLLFSISFLDCALKMFWISWRRHWVPRWPTSSKRCSKHRYINQNNNNSQNNNSTNRKRNHQTHPRVRATGEDCAMRSDCSPSEREAVGDPRAF